MSLQVSCIPDLELRFFFHKTYCPREIQCAAVTTQSGAIKDPPQLNDLELPLSRAI